MQLQEKDFGSQKLMIRTFFQRFLRQRTQNNMKLNDLLKEAYDSASTEILLEGGASGHMSHLFEDPDLKFKDLKDIFTKLFKGKLTVSEKTDG